MPPAPTTALTGEMRWLSADRHAGDEALESGARVPRRKREYSVNVTGVCSIAGVRMPCMHPRIRVSLLAAETRPLHEVKVRASTNTAHLTQARPAPIRASPQRCQAPPSMHVKKQPHENPCSHRRQHPIPSSLTPSLPLLTLVLYSSTVLYCTPVSSREPAVAIKVNPALARPVPRPCMLDSRNPGHDLGALTDRWSDLHAKHI